MAARDGYEDKTDAIVGGILRPDAIRPGGFVMHAELLSDRLFAAMWPVVFERTVAAFGLEKAPIEAVTAAATEATWNAVDEALAERLERHNASAVRAKLNAEGGDGGN